MSLKGEYLNQGIQALENGNPAAAAAAFTQLVKQLPEDDEGWLWLGKAVTAPDRKEFCFKRAIQLNPANAEAGHLLAELGHSTTAVKPQTRIEARQPAPPDEKPIAAFFAPQSPAPSAPPFLAEDLSQEPVMAAEPAVPAPPTPTGTDPVPEHQEQPPRKKSPRRLLIVLAIVAALIVCGLAAFFLLTSGILDGLTALLPVQPLPTQAQLIPATQAAGPAPTSTPSPSTATPTEDAPILATMLPTVVYTASFRETPCAFEKPEGIVVNCGFLTVPEDRTDPASGNIQLAVAIFRSTAASPAPDPVVFLQGGPGGEAVLLSAAAFPFLVEPFLAERDFIAIDQRGTGLSEPALGCDELVSVYKQDIEGQIPESSRGFIYDNAFRSCHGMMAISGIDLGAYTTLESAADIRDLAVSLGLAQVNLYGASYGTRLAQVVMRNDPALVRSAILDSVVPVDVALYNTDQIRFGYALDHLFASCASDQACNRAYSELETVFWDAVAQLNAQPVSVTAPLLTGGEVTEEVSGSDLIGIVLGMLKNSDLIASVPQAIYRIRGGDYSTFVAAQSSLPFAFEGIDIGLYISMMCREHIMATTESELQAALETQMDLGLYSRLPFLGDAGDLFEICHVWGTEAPRQGENNPLVSDIPTLVIEGAFDPTTPPLFGQRILTGLTQATYVEFPNQGHVPTAADVSGCAMQIVQDFISAPQQSPDSSCARGLDQIAYILPYTGTPPETLVEFAGDGFNAQRPESWEEQGDGVFLRASSPMDITQVMIIRTFLSSSELLDSLSSTLYGYQGFDSAPLQTGTRQQNGLTWSLYQTSSYGRPVELAMADTNGTAIVVLLFCHEDEREALIQTVYLPMIDSVLPLP